MGVTNMYGMHGVFTDRDTHTQGYTAVLYSLIAPVIGVFWLTRDSNTQNRATYE